MARGAAGLTEAWRGRAAAAIAMGAGMGWRGELFAERFAAGVACLGPAAALQGQQPSCGCLGVAERSRRRA